MSLLALIKLKNS